MKQKNGLMAAIITAALASPAYAAEIPVTFSGGVEVEAGTSENYGGVTTTDIVLAKVEMAIDAELNDRVSAHIAYLYEDDATALDEGTITLKFNDTTSLIAGHAYVPFGDFSSYMVSDPLTLALGETSEDVLMLSMESGKVSGSVYTFNGDADEISEAPNDDALSFGANIGYTTDDIWMGVSYISNIADTNGLQDPGNTIDSAVAGMGVYFGMNINRFSIIAEHVAAMESFTNGDSLAGNTVVNEETPTATNMEVAFNMNDAAIIAVAYQMTDEADFLGLPETATSIAVSFDVMEAAGVGIEYRTSENYDGDTDSVLTVKLAVEF
jgi:hypothetical protein